MRAALEAVLLFHSGGPWNADQCQKWLDATDSDECTTKVLCDTVRAALKALDALPKIFIFCNSCAPEWHSAVALADDGTFLAGHVCSNHGFIQHDMGINSSWKRDLYEKHYPGGYELVWVPNPRQDNAALEAAVSKSNAAAERLEAGDAQ